jgi:hypothetical protein
MIDTVIPGIGGSEVGPLAVLISVAAASSLVAYFLFFTVYRDRPQLRVRRSAAVVSMVGGLLLAAAGMFLPYQGTTGERCPPALRSQGFHTDALASGRSEDPCATAGKLLVTFAWTAPVLMLMVVGVAWYAKTSG